MKQSELMNILDDVATGKVTKEEALLAIKEEPFKDMGFAKIDTHRGIRQGVPEVIYGAGKTKEQIKEIVKYLQKSGEETVLITRMSSEAAKFVSEEIDLRYDEISKVGIVGSMPKKDGIGTIVVATAGTSDMFFRIFSPSNSTTMLRRLIIFSMISACLPSFFLRKYALFRQRTYQITVYNKIPDMSMIFLHKCRFF